MHFYFLLMVLRVFFCVKKHIILSAGEIYELADVKILVTLDIFSAEVQQ